MYKDKIYNEDIKLAIIYVKSEIRMREIVFKNHPAKRNKKVKEMEHVLKVLNMFIDKYPAIQKDMFH